MADDVITVAEVAERLRIGRRQTYAAIARGEIPGVVRIGRSIRVSSRALEIWLLSGKGVGTQPEENSHAG